MDTQTLVMANVLMFALYAGVMLVHARVIGGTQGAMFFAGANLCRGAAMLMTGIQWLRLAPVGVSQALTGLLAVVGLMLLHESFATLLERGPMMRWVQTLIVVLIIVGGMCLLLFPWMAPGLEGLLYALLGTQLAVTAAIVFRFLGEEMGLAGWLTGLALMSYAAIQIMRATVMLRYGTPRFEVESTVMTRIWLVGCLLSSGAIAFGYMALATAKLRVELLWRAQVDELTGLLNRWALKRTTMQELNRSRRRKAGLAMLMMDLDGLKEVNDTTGHASGDVVLQAVAGVLQETVRAQDSVGRMGGDEFCVLLPETSQSEAMAVAERLRMEVEELVIQYRGSTVRVSASIGVASSKISGLTWQALVDHSDSALYRAKREGRNRVVMAGGKDIPADDSGKREGALLERRRVGRGGDEGL